MSATLIPTMIVDNVELRAQPRLTFHGDPIDCDHLWEPHLGKTNSAYCARCGASARWINTGERVKS